MEALFQLECEKVTSVRLVTLSLRILTVLWPSVLTFLASRFWLCGVRFALAVSSTSDPELLVLPLIKLLSQFIFTTPTPV